MNRPLSQVIELEQGQKKEDMIQSLKADEAELESLLARNRQKQKAGELWFAACVVQQHVLRSGSNHELYEISCQDILTAPAPVAPYTPYPISPTSSMGTTLKLGGESPLAGDCSSPGAKGKAGMNSNTPNTPNTDGENVNSKKSANEKPAESEQ